MLGISTDSFFIRLADVDGFDITFWVGVFMAISAAAISVFVHKVNPVAGIRDGGLPLWAAGALQAGSSSVFVIAVTLTSVSNVVVIVAAAPVFAAGLSALVLGERTERRVWFAIAMVLVGVVIVVSGSFGGGSVFGDLLALCAILQFGVSLVLLRKYPELDRTLMVMLGGVGMACIAVLPATRLVGHESKTWIALLLMGLVFGPVARILLSVATRYLPAAEVGLFTPTETVAASLWAWMFFQEAPAATTFIGGAIIVAAVLWGTWTPRGARPKAQIVT